MNKSITRLLIVLIMAAFSATLSAQNNQAQQHNQRQRMSRAQMAEMQARHIARQLCLDEATCQKFTEVFCEYQKKVWALRPQGRHQKKKEEMTDAEVEQAIKNQFDHSQKILTLRQEYYRKYSEFLSPKQIQRVYELERQAMNRLSKRNKNRAAQPGKQ